jgi:predicted enzyme related to lactoylglutathione lyase
MAEVNTFCWNELNAKDAAACKKFYGAVFGWTAPLRRRRGSQRWIFLDYSLEGVRGS